MTGTTRLKRRAAIKSLGFSGTNAHIVVGEYLPPAEINLVVPVIPQDTNIIVPVSARTAAQVKEKARDLLEFMRPRQKTLDLVSMAYTLQVGREAMEERVGLVVSSVEQLAEKLEAYVAGKEGIEESAQREVEWSKTFCSLFSRYVG